MIHNLWKNTKHPRINVEIMIRDSRIPLDFLIPAVIPIDA